MNTPTLDLVVLPSYSSALLVVGDVSTYPVGFNINTPTIEITPPSFVMKSIPFVPKTLQVYNAESLGIVCDTCDKFPLPDGIYTLKYSVTPAYLYFVEKTFLRVDQLVEKYDTVYLKLDILQCDLALKKEQKKELDHIWAYINGAIASANQCANKQAMELYTRASHELDIFQRNMDRCKTTW